MDPRPVTLRPASSRPVAVVVWGVAAVLAADVIVRGLPGSAWTFLPWLAVASLAVWMVMWVPGLIVTSDGVEVREVIRTYRLPYGCIEHISPGGLVKIEYRDAERVRTLTTWVGAVRQAKRSDFFGSLGVRAFGRRGDDLLLTSDADVPEAPGVVVVEHWRAWTGAPESPTVSLRWVPLALLIALLFLAVL